MGADDGIKGVEIRVVQGVGKRDNTGVSVPDGVNQVVFEEVCATFGRMGV